MFFFNGFHVSMHLASWLMLLTLCGAGFLRTCALWRLLGGQAGSMRCILSLGSCFWRCVALVSCEHALFGGSLGPGRLHEGPRWPWRGSSGAAWRALFLQFYSGFTLSMHLALWLMDLELGGARGGPGNGTCQFYCTVIVFFDAHKGGGDRMA